MTTINFIIPAAALLYGVWFLVFAIDETINGGK